jgi:hypothetical protein
MGKKTGGGTSTTSQSSEPWKAIQPDLQSMYTHARQAGGRPMEFFPTQTYANNSYETNLAQALQSQRGMNGSPVTDAMQGEITNTLGGNYLNSNPAMNLLMPTASGQYLDAGNPYLSGMKERTANDITKAYNSTFGGGGRWGSGAHAQGLGSGISDAFAAMDYQNYGDERNRQMAASGQIGQMYGDERGRMMQASALAPAAANQDYFDIAKVAEVGAQKDAMEQQGIDEAMARHEFQYAEPWNRLGNWNSILSGGMDFGTKTGTTRQPTQRSSLGADLLGAGMLGASLFAGPAGPAMMAGAGALGGMGKGGRSPTTAMAGPGGLLGGRV